MKTVLLGGFDPGFQAQITKAFEPFKGEYTLLTVGSLGELLVMLETAQGDLLFLDLDAPGGMSLEWLAHVAEIRSSIPILGAGQAERPDITSYELRFPGHYFPFVTYLRKPLTADQIVMTVQSEIRHVARGVIEGLSLSSLLQMLHMEGKTCTLRVNSGRRQGFFYMRAGQIINARYRRAEGMDAALMLLASASPKAEIDGQLHDSTHLIHARIEELMMEAMRIKDEQARDPRRMREDDGPDDPEDMPSSELGKWDSSAIITLPVEAAAGRPSETSAGAAAAAPGQPTKGKGKRFLWIAAAVILPVSVVPFFIPRDVTVAVQSTPPGAIISLNGQRQGAAPLQLTLSKPVQGDLRAELEGHEPQTHALQPGEETITLALKAVPPPPPPPAEAAVEPAPEPEPAPKAVASKSRKPAPAKAAPKPGKPRKGDVFDQIRQP